MYLWRVDRLVEDFRNDQVTEREKLKYMILYAVVYAAVIDAVFWTGHEFTYMDAGKLLVDVLINVYGTYYCYAKNRAGDNRDFITRYMCIGLPVGVRVLVFFIPVFFVAGVLAVAYGIGTRTNEFGQSVSYTTWLDVLVTGAPYAVMYLYLGNKIAAVAKVAPAPEQR
ncbi:MAG: hypothetical protein ACOYXY_08520 [Thermodesulfobacteriota bacterium]